MTVNGPWRISFRFKDGDAYDSAETALRLARYFGNNERFWMNLQTRYELIIAKQNIGKKIESEVERAA